ncbi:hypothetical protein Q3W71_27625 [Micromonospora sp. C28SCA-DRY-2]|uniref:hypothetical protein n=1 Tax=Micromonospora sp. C28SCA-DRY-2 TaxID=3059522 RepID=UPI002674E214|nr:hypothetical protein [Micromonospora sp. C28SCA-DRY-2]MDO3705447.1 hypothetical protein [Micromonospora sp. C28SCA-DRY-2]
MEATAEPARSRFRTWVTPSRVAFLGTAVAVLLLTLPIHIRSPGDHETAPCGTALALDLDRWVGPMDGNYWEQAYRTCNSRRIDRIGKAVGVLSLTVLAVTLLASARRRDDDER